jgi:hypothetical protein
MFKPIAKLKKWIEQAQYSHTLPHSLTFLCLAVLEVLKVAFVHRLRDVGIIPNAAPLFPDLKTGARSEPGGAWFHGSVHAVLELGSLVHVDEADAQASCFGARHTFEDAL